jgi:hypothetical protein
MAAGASAEVSGSVGRGPLSAGAKLTVPLSGESPTVDVTGKITYKGGTIKPNFAVTAKSTPIGDVIIRAKVDAGIPNLSPVQKM